MGLFGSGTGFLGTGDTPTAPTIDPGGGMMGAGRSVAGVNGTDAAGQAQTSGMLNQMAQGGGPNPAMAALHQGINSAQAQAQAQAGSARGQFGLANAQHDAMQTSAGLQQQAAGQGAVLQQQQQFQAIQMQMQQQQQKRAQDLMALGMDQQTAIAQAQLEAQQNLANQGIASSNSTAGMGLIGAGLGGLAGMMVGGPAGAAVGAGVGSKA